MADYIYISPESLYTNLIKSAPDHLSEATNLMRKVYSSTQAAVSVPCGEQWHVFALNERTEILSCLERLKKLSGLCSEICSIAAAAPGNYEAADKSFKGTLSYSWIERVKIRLNDYRGNAIPNYSFSEVIHRMFSHNAPSTAGITEVTENPGINETSHYLGPSSASEKHSVGVKPGDKDQGSKILKKIWNSEVDNARSESGSEYFYGSKSSGRYQSGTFTFLGSDFGYDKYTDYSTADFKQSSGDSFYSYDASLKREGYHYDFYELVPNGAEGELTINGVSTYGDGDFDLAKGNAYIRAGADYKMYSFGTTLDNGNATKMHFDVGLGVGGHLNFGIHNGTFTADIGAALGVGGSVSLEIDYEQCWNDIKGALCLN